MPDNLTQKVKCFIREHKILRGGEHVLVAVSGGADSVALLNILAELSRPLRLRLTVAHLNHQIRGKDAEDDARFVAQLARRLHLDFVIGRVNVPRLADRMGISLEMAGRRARYDFFAKTALARRCNLVATAHTADDSAESILLMLVRGCGLQGLTGIQPLSKAGKITVARPLLGTDRPTIENYLRGRNLGWREDVSNADPAFLRNRVRHELLPLLEAKYNKGIKETLNRMSEVLREENDFIECFTEKAYCEAIFKSSVDRKTTHILDSRFHGNDRLDTCLAKYHRALRRRILRHWLKTNGLNAGTLDFQTINKLDKLLMNPAGGRALELSGGKIIRRYNQRLEIERHKTQPSAYFSRKIRIPGKTILPETGLIVMAKLAQGIERERAKFGKFPTHASLSLKRLGRKQVIARTWRPGDRMNPHGLDGSKKVQDIFSDAKLPANLRRQWPLFECGGAIIWIPGYRIAEGWQVSDAADIALQLMVDVVQE